MVFVEKHMADLTGRTALTMSTAVVVIGRNEGERLALCLRSVLGCCSRVVYVDSGSKDGSPGLAARMGVETLTLDSARLFSAARGRNEGFLRLRKLFPSLKY